MKWVFFGIGIVVGGVIGVVTMSLCAVSGAESRREEMCWDETDTL